MAELTQDQVARVYTDVGPRTWSLFTLRGISGGDTIDLAALGFYQRVIAVLIMPVSAAGNIGTPGLPGGAVVAVPSGLSNDAAYLLVDGIPA